MPSRFPIAAFLLCLGILVFGLLLLRPFWGLMDDGNLLDHALRLREGNLWQESWRLFRGDLQWGMVRPYFGPYVWALYGFSQESAVPLLLINLLWVLGALALLFFFVLRSKMGAVWSDPRGRQEDWHIGAKIAFLLLVCLALPWTHNYFLFPSLQEKVVVTVAAFVFAWFASEHAQRASLPIFFLISLLLVAIGFCTKGQFLAFAPLMLAALWSREHQFPWRKALVVVLLFATGAIFLKWVASGGNYTRVYALGTIRENLRLSLSFRLFLALTLAHQLWILRLALKGRLLWRDAFLATAPTFGLQLFLFMMLPWRLGGYLNTSIAPFAALTLGFWAFRIQREGRTSRLLVQGVAALAVVVTAQQAYAHWAPLMDLRHIVENSREGKWPASVQEVFNSCAEGHSHLKNYLRRFGGLTRLEVIYVNRDAPATAPALAKGKKTYWIVQEGWCPIVHSEIPAAGTRRMLLLGGKRGNSFQLVEVEGL